MHLVHKENGPCGNLTLLATLLEIFEAIVLGWMMSAKQSNCVPMYYYPAQNAMQNFVVDFGDNHSLKTRKTIRRCFIALFALTVIIIILLIIWLQTI